MPATLATTGKVTMGRKDISRLIGRVFLEKCAANLLYSVGRCRLTQSILKCTLKVPGSKHLKLQYASLLSCYFNFAFKLNLRH
jgi:hypothetical protein